MAKPSPDRMNFQADRIERVLASHRVPVRVHSGTVMPRWIRFLLTPALGAKVASVRNLSEELALALGAADVRVAREGESITVVEPRERPIVVMQAPPAPAYGRPNGYAPTQGYAAPSGYNQAGYGGPPPAFDLPPRRFTVVGGERVIATDDEAEPEDEPWTP